MWPGEKFGFRGTGNVVYAWTYEEVPEETRPKVGDVIVMPGAQFEVDSVEHDPTIHFGEGLMKMTARRLPG